MVSTIYPQPDAHIKEREKVTTASGPTFMIMGDGVFAPTNVPAAAPASTQTMIITAEPPRTPTAQGAAPPHAGANEWDLVGGIGGAIGGGGAYGRSIPPQAIPSVLNPTPYTPKPPEVPLSTPFVKVEHPAAPTNQRRPHHAALRDEGITADKLNAASLAIAEQRDCSVPGKGADEKLLLNSKGGAVADMRLRRALGAPTPLPMH